MSASDSFANTADCCGSPCTRNTFRKEGASGSIHCNNSCWSAWPLSSSMLEISARTRNGSPKIATSGHFSTNFRPSVSCAWNPVISTVFRGSSILLRKWWRIRPCSHIPEAEMTTNGPCRSFSFFESSASRTYCKRPKPKGFHRAGGNVRTFGAIRPYRLQTQTAATQGGKIGRHHRGNRERAIRKRTDRENYVGNAALG